MKGPLSQLGRYQILEKIASGGMASVYRAKIEGTSKLVALKVLHPHLADDEEHTSMFADEGRLCTRLSHPNLVGALDHGVIEGYHYIALDFLPCVSLATLCDHLQATDRALELGDALHIVSEVLAGLAEAHGLADDQGLPLGVVHRDVSPQNVLVTTTGEVKVIDFGIARGRMRSMYSAVGVVKGKAGYMSPEQAAGFPDLDARTDIYASAVLAYELLCGRALFGDGDTERIRRRIINAPDPALPADADLPAPLEEALARALRKSPDDRFADAVSFRTAIEAVLAELRYHPDRGAIGALARDALEAREAALRKERKAREQDRKAEAKAKRKKQPEKGAPGKQATPATARDDVDSAVRWMARAALLVMALGLLMEIFGLNLPSP